MRWFLVLLGIVSAGLGCVGLLVHAGILDGALPLYTVILPPMVLHLPDRSPFTDAAHGPPFLTVLGVLVVYFLPATVLLSLAWFPRARTRTAA